MNLYEITQETFSKYIENITKAREGFDLSDFINQRKDEYIENEIGFVHIYGTLLHDASPIEKQLGNTDYQDIIEECIELIQKGVKAIVFEVDSGGGTVLGAVECAEFIQSLPVPTIAYVNGVAASAAYKLISGCSYIVASKSSILGSIGTIMVMTDTTLLNKAIGIKYIPFVNEDAIYKSIGHLDSLTDEQKIYLQETVNELGKQFQEYVLDNRPETNSEVFTAATYRGNKAVEVGLLDMVGSKEDAINVAVEFINRFSQQLTLE